MVSPIRMDNSSEGSKLPSLLTSLIKTGNYSFLKLCCLFSFLLQEEPPVPLDLFSLLLDPLLPAAGLAEPTASAPLSLVRKRNIRASLFRRPIIF
jgi:hypothetical protein